MKLKQKSARRIFRLTSHQLSHRRRLSTWISLHLRRVCHTPMSLREGCRSFDKRLDDTIMYAPVGGAKKSATNNKHETKKREEEERYSADDEGVPKFIRFTKKKLRQKKRKTKFYAFDLFFFDDDDEATTTLKVL